MLDEKGDGDFGLRILDCGMEINKPQTCLRQAGTQINYLVTCGLILKEEQTAYSSTTFLSLGYFTS